LETMKMLSAIYFPTVSIDNIVIIIYNLIKIKGL
jgi:hypothetical protein